MCSYKSIAIHSQSRLYNIIISRNNKDIYKIIYHSVYKLTELQSRALYLLLRISQINFKIQLKTLITNYTKKK